MSSVTTLLNRDSFLILDDNGLVNVVLNQKYSDELRYQERSYDYSYVSLNDGSPINTIGFTDLGIIKLINELNVRKFQSDKRLHVFNFELEPDEFVVRPECTSIIPYIDTSQASDHTLSSFASRMIEFINGLDKEGVHGIVVSFLRRYDDGKIARNYAAHVTPLLIAHEKDRSLVFIFDNTGFELMGRQEEYGIVKIPTLRSSNSNCFAYSFSVLNKCLSHPGIIGDLLSKTSCSVGQLERLSFQDLPPELMQYLESVSNKVKYTQQIGCYEKILNSKVAKIWIRTLKQDGTFLCEEKLISCNLYNKTYQLALKLLGDSSSTISLQLQEECQNFQRQQFSLKNYSKEIQKNAKAYSIKKSILKIAVVIGSSLLAYHFFYSNRTA